MIRIATWLLRNGKTVASASPPMIVLKTLNPTYRKTPIACGMSAPK